MTISSRLMFFQASLGFGVVLITLGAGCWNEPTPVAVQSQKTNETNLTTNQTEFVGNNITSVTGDINTTLTPDELATALVNEVDTLGSLYAVRPEIIQFNDQLDPATADDSEFFLARHWWDEVSGDSAFENAITKFNSPALAVTAIQDQVNGKTAVTPSIELGDVQAVYYEAATADRLATLTYRFAIGQYSVRLTIFSTTEAAADLASVKQALLPQLESIAIIQNNKLADVLTATTVTLPTNTAIEHLPEALAGATELGTTTVNFIEWYGTTYDLASDEFPGFISGGLRRFKINARPDEVIEVTVIEFATPNQATAFVKELLPSLPDATELTLPETMADSAAAVNNDGFLELQTAQENFVFDFSLFSPFGSINETAAVTDLVNLSETVVLDFAE